MKGQVLVLAMLLGAFAASAQVASHAPTMAANAPMANTAGQTPAQLPPRPVTDKPVARVNGAVLTDRDLLREMYAIFPYARQHNGFPKSQEAAIRQGALEMIIFEELVYQEAGKRKITVSAAQISQGEAAFKKQFESPDQFSAYLQSEMQGSEAKLRRTIERSILIDRVLKSEVDDKAAVSPAEVRAYYEKNPARFAQPESFAFQSISIVPPLTPTAQQATEAKKKAEDALRQAKETKGYQDFGLLAEKISEDDFRVNYGDHKTVGREKLPPQVLKAFATMKPGQISGLIQIESAYTIVRLNAHTAARKQPFDEVKTDLRTELQKAKYEKLRSNFAKQLRGKAKIEVV